MDITRCPQAPAQAGRPVGCARCGGSGRKEPWSLAGAALPSLGPRWRCAPSVSPAPAGIHLQLPAPDPWPGEHSPLLPSPQLPLPGILPHLMGAPPSRMVMTAGGPQRRPNLLPPKCCGGPHSSPESAPGSPPAQVPGTLPCRPPLPCCSRAASPHPARPRRPLRSS